MQLNYAIKRKLSIALAIASAITILEIFGAILSNSIALLSDAGHLFGDVMALSISLLAIGLATKEHTKRLTYGYHRAEILAAFANGITLAVIAGLVVKEAYTRLFDPPSIEPVVLLSIAIIGFAANIIMAFILREARETSINVRAAYVHVFYDAISSIGVIIAGALVATTNYYVIDPIIAFLIAGLIARGAIKILKESVHILLEGTPATVEVKKIVSEIKKIDGVIDIHDLHVWTISSGINALSGHVIVKDQMVSESAKIVDSIREMLKTKFDISHTTVQVESAKDVVRIKDTD
ncbi:MAG: cation diffusion facilitator family transporter [Nitrososphaerales archaeon]